MHVRSARNATRAVQHTPSMPPIPSSLLISLLTSLLALLSSTAAHAMQWYEIDMVIFTNLSEQQKESENWEIPNNEHLDYFDNAIPFEEAEYEGPQNFQRVRGITEDRQAMMSGLDRGGIYRTLFSASWRQPIQSKNRANPYIITGGEQFGPRSELEGTVKLSVARYLHIDTDLRLSEYMLRGEARRQGLLPEEAVPAGPNLLESPSADEDYSRIDRPYESDQEQYQPAQPTGRFLGGGRDHRIGNRGAEEGVGSGAMGRMPRTAGEESEFGDETEGEGDEFGYQHAVLSDNEYIAIKAFSLEQSRRMRSKELHYIDHPAIGLLIKIKKVDNPTPDPGTFGQGQVRSHNSANGDQPNTLTAPWEQPQ